MKILSSLAKTDVIRGALRSWWPANAEFGRIGKMLVMRLTREKVTAISAGADIEIDERWYGCDFSGISWQTQRS